MWMEACVNRLEDDLRDVQQELVEAREQLRHKEDAPIDHRVADEDRYMVSLLRLQTRVRALEEEERKLLAVLSGESEEG